MFERDYNQNVSCVMPNELELRTAALGYEPAAIQGEFRSAAPQLIELLQGWEVGLKPFLSRLGDQLCAAEELSEEQSDQIADIGHFLLRVSDDIMTELERRRGTPKPTDTGPNDC